jgi:hypothetical protein
MTFVLVILFWGTAKGYAITNVPGYKTEESCKSAAMYLHEHNPNTYNPIVAICIQGPTP